MIVTCPQCSVQFSLDDALLGDKGRKVKCSSCGHVWHQEPPQPEAANEKETETEQFPVDVEEDESGESFDEVLNQLEEKIQDESTEPAEEVSDQESQEGELSQDIPDAVKPIPEEPPEEIKKPAVQDSKEARIAGYSIGGVLFIILFVFFLLGSDGTMKRWPASIGFFSLFGIEAPAFGEGLSFDRVEIEKTNDYELSVTGHILNLSSKAQPIHYIRAVLIDNEGEPLATWFVDVQEDFLNAQETLSFRTLYTGLNKGAKRVDLSFQREKPESMVAREAETTHDEKEDGEDHGDDPH